MLESKGLFPELEQVVSSHVDSGENLTMYDPSEESEGRSWTKVTYIPFLY